jgi:asparagine synthase (glutamine-hydrolysing)
MRLQEAGSVDLGPSGMPVILPLEVAIGWPPGGAHAQRPQGRVDPNPVAALRAALRPALERPPCVVAFSGGRDSSLLLAVAVDLAAREGLPPPVAVTLRYPGDIEADETAWQELVVAALRGRPFEWVRREITDELDVIGPVTRPVLRAHGGPVFPAALGNTILLARLAAGGSLVTGNFGDEVLGGHRAAVLRAAARRRGAGMGATDWRQVAACATPGRLRPLLYQVDPTPWLRPGPRAALVAETKRVEAGRPLRWDRSVDWALASRAVAVGNRTRGRVAYGHDCRLVEPLGDPAFVAAIAAFGGPWGRLTRGMATRLLAGGLLPDALCGRKDKASFNTSRFGPVARAFAQDWDGRGVDVDLVDPVALRAAWLATSPPAATAMLLQQAWLSCKEAV